ncbi:MAG: ATP-binding cassette domain-containing protein [Kiritimatiellia bacterium]|jgi:ABC-type multidrug transport system ATPase subunit|nr:ATP-binding cassette domain-containing protein [Kiritimatiellia bacterium]
MPHPPAIEFDQLTLAFDGRTLLQDFSLQVQAGEKVVLAGASGSGKSSLLACLLGFVSPVAGRIAINGETLTPKSIWHLRHSMALVQQEPDIGDQSAEEWIREPFSFHANESLRGNLERLPDLLPRLHLAPGLLRQKGTDLSGGEKQRMAIVAALLLDRPILLLDEPTSALDPDSRLAVYDCLAQIEGKTLLMVSHDTGPALDFASRIVRLSPPEVPHGRT